jgi:pyruvate ferredoxin oxidoreductase alpha subunit
VVGITTFRPFPVEEVRRTLADARRVVVVEKAFRPGGGGLLSADITLALRDAGVTVHTVVAGLGGRPITRRGIESVLGAADRGELGELSFLDLDNDVVGQERARILSSAPVDPSGGAAVRRRPPPVATRVGEST